METRNLVSKILLAVMLVMPCSLQAEELTEVQYLVLTQTDGTIIAKFALSDSPVMTFQDGDVLVTCGDKTIQSSLEGIVSCTFSNELVTTGIRETVRPSSDGQPQFSFGTASFEGMQPGSRIIVYTLDGKAVASTVTDGEGRASISFANLQHGVYILRTPGKSYKISK